MNNHAMAQNFMTVFLNPAEQERAALVGVRRQISALRLGCKQKYGNSGCDAWTGNIEAAAGEMIVAEATRSTWDTTTPQSFARKLPDVADFIDVRTGSKDSYRLIVHPDDPDEHAMVLVTGRIPLLTIRGWMWARDAKQEKYWEDPSGLDRWAFFVPTSDLLEFSELVKFLTEP